MGAKGDALNPLSTRTSPFGSPTITLRPPHTKGPPPLKLGRASPKIYKRPFQSALARHYAYPSNLPVHHPRSTMSPQASSSESSKTENRTQRKRSPSSRGHDATVLSAPSPNHLYTVKWDGSKCLPESCRIRNLIRVLEDGASLRPVFSLIFTHNFSANSI